MASKREIKKDINYLTYEVISDCYTYVLLHQGKQTEEVAEIIDTMMKKRDDLIHRVNNVESNDKKIVRNHFREIYKNLLEITDESFGKLSKLTKA
ncbi:MAG: hypothetical protein ABIJ97_18135 [Bacteroidota bacterium]